MKITDDQAKTTSGPGSGSGMKSRRVQYLKAARAIQGLLAGETMSKLYTPKTDPFPASARPKKNPILDL